MTKQQNLISFSYWKYILKFMTKGHLDLASNCNLHEYFLQKWKSTPYFLKIEKVSPIQESSVSTPIIAHLYHIHYFSQSPPKIKKFGKIYIFSLLFSIIVQIFIDFNAYFWKMLQNFSDLPNSKISFHPRKQNPQTFWWTPQPKNPA